jgi:hypothetical protein
MDLIEEPDFMAGFDRLVKLIRTGEAGGCVLCLYIVRRDKGLIGFLHFINESNGTV